MSAKLLLAVAQSCLAANFAFAAAEPPSDWVDPDTGHRVIRLSTEPGSASLYFHQNSFTPQGDKFVFDTPSGIAAVDLTQLGKQPVKIDLVVPRANTDTPEVPPDETNAGPRFRRVVPRVLAAAWKTRDVYFFRNGVLCAANIDTHAVREIISGRFNAINCDETIVVRTVGATDPSGKIQPPAPRTIAPQRERMFGDKLKAGLTLTPEEERGIL